MTPIVLTFSEAIARIAAPAPTREIVMLALEMDTAALLAEFEGRRMVAELEENSTKENEHAVNRSTR